MKNTKLSLIIIFSAAITLALLLMLIKDAPISIEGHDADFHRVAISLLDGGGFDCGRVIAGIIKLPNARHPLYPLFISGIYSFTNNSLTAVKLAQILIHGFTCIIIYLISKILFKKELISLASAAAWAIYPLPISLTIWLFSETLFIFLLSLSILFLLKNRQMPGLKNAFLSGLFLGFTILTKSIILPFIPILFFWSVLTSKNRLAPKLRNFLIILSSLFLTISPWLLRNYIVHKSALPMATGGAVSFYSYNNEKALEMVNDPLRFVYPFTEEQKRELSGLSELEANKYLTNLGWQFIQSHPKDFLRRAAIELNRFWHLWPASPKTFTEYYLKARQLDIQDSFFDKFLDRFKGSWFLYFCKILYHLPYNILFLGMFATLVSSFRKDREMWNRCFLLFLLILTVNIVYIFHHGNARYRVPIDPYVFMMGFYAVAQFYNNLKKRREK